MTCLLINATTCLDVQELLIQHRGTKFYHKIALLLVSLMDTPKVYTIVFSPNLFYSAYILDETTRLFIPF